MLRRVADDVQSGSCRCSSGCNDQHWTLHNVVRAGDKWLLRDDSKVSHRSCTTVCFRRKLCWQLKLRLDVTGSVIITASLGTCRYCAPATREWGNKHCFCLSVHLSVSYIANNSRTQKPSVPKFGRNVPNLTNQFVSRSNGQRWG